MAPTTSRKSRAVEDGVLAALLSLQAEDGFVSNADVRRAAAVLDCSTRRIRRMISRGYTHRPREPWVPDEQVTARLVRCKGNIAALRRDLDRSGEAPEVSARTMQRGFQHFYEQQMLAGSRRGYKDMWGRLPFERRMIDCRNEEWAIDHTLLPVFVRLPDGTYTKPWMTTILDAATRMVLAVTLTPHSPTLEESVETVALAVEGWVDEDGQFYGGKPNALMSDRGGDLVTRALTTGLIGEGVERRHTEAYSAHQNGRIERWHRTIKEELCVSLPGFDRADRTARDPRREGAPLGDPEMLLPIEGVHVEVLKAVRDYNTARQHSSLNGQTPAQAWAADPAEITHADAEAIRAAMTQEVQRKVRRGTVQFDNRIYVMPHTKVTVSGVERAWRDVIEGKTVILRYLPSKVEFVEVFSLETGESIGRALWSELLDPTEASKHLADRRRIIATWRASLNEIAVADAAAVQAHRDAALTAQPADDFEVTFSPVPDPRPAARTDSQRSPRSRSRAAAKANKNRSAANQVKRDAERARRKASLAVLEASVLVSTNPRDAVGF